MNRLGFFLTILLVTLACSHKQTIIINDQVSNKAELAKLDSADIFTYSDWPLGTAPPKYKEHKTDLIVVRTWRHETLLQEERHNFLSYFIGMAEKGDDILIVYNGVEVTNEKLGRLRSLQPKDLKSVDTLMRIAAAQILKEKAKSKNVIVNTYDLKADLIRE